MKGKIGMWLCIFIVVLIVISVYFKGIRIKE